MVGKYKVITLCGSTRFKDAFLEAQTEMMLDVMEMYPGRPACFGF